MTAAAVPGRAEVLALLRRREAEIMARAAVTGPGPGDGDGDDSRLCPVRGCRWRVAPGKLMCPGHWRQVPRAMQAAIWRSWDNGKGAGAPAHQAAVNAAIGAVNRQQRAGR